MGTHKNKSEVAWLVTLLLERDRSYSAKEIDDVIRASIRPDLLSDPQYAPDHIRLAMVENQFVERDSAGTAYRVHPGILLPNENEHVYRQLQLEALQAKPSDVMACPICDSPYKASTVVGHYLRTHRLAGVWESLMDSYAR
jgi:hypothetical protein